MPELRAKVLIDISQSLKALDSVKQAIQSVKNVVFTIKTNPTEVRASAESSANLFKSEFEGSVDDLEVPKLDVTEAERAGKVAGEKFSENFKERLKSTSFGAVSFFLGNLLYDLSGRFVEFGKSVLSASADLEKTTVGFETLIGNAEEARRVLSEIQKYAEKTPYEEIDLTKATQTFLSFGLSAKEATEMIKVVGDIAMGDARRLESLALAFSKVASAGKLSGEELGQMIDAGFNPLQIISEKTGISIGELRKKMEEGAIGADMVKNAFLSATSEGGRFFNMAEKQSKTFSGLMSTLKDNVTKLGISIGKEAFEGLKRLVEQTIAIIGKIKDAFEKEGLKGIFKTIFPPDVGAVIYSILANLVGLLKTIGKTLWELKPILVFILGTIGTWVVLTQTITLVTNAITILRTAWTALNVVIASNPIVAIAAAIVGLAILIYTYWSDIKNFFINLWNSIVEIFNEALEFIKNAVAFAFKVVFDIVTLSNPIGLLVRTIKGDWGVFQGVLDTLKSAFGDVFDKISNKVSNTVSNIINWFKNWWLSIEQGNTIFAKLFRTIRETASQVAKVISYLWGKVVGFITDAWNKIVEIWKKAKEFFFGKEEGVKEQKFMLDTTEAKKSSEELKETQIENSKEVMDATIKNEQLTFDFSKSNIEQKGKKQKEEHKKRLEEAREYLSEQQKQNKELERSLELLALDEYKDRLTIRKQELDASLQDLQSQKDIVETIDAQKQILLERYNIEKEILEIETKRKVSEQIQRLETEIEKETERYNKARENAKNNKELLEKIDEEYNETITNLYRRTSLELQSIERDKNSQLFRLSDELNDRLSKLEKEANDKRLKETEASAKKTLSQIQKTYEAFQNIYQTTTPKADTSEVERQIEELDRAFLKGTISEQEFTRKREELTRKRTELLKQESDEFNKTFAKAYETSFNLLLELSPQVKEIDDKINDLLLSLTDVSNKFGQQFLQAKTSVTSFSDYFNELGNKLAENWETITQHIALQTGMLGGKLIAQGIPPLEAFKKAFLVTMLDMVEKLVITQLPAISALISGTIPFPANLPIIALITAMIMTGLELAKSKIRGAHEGYLAGFREGTIGSGDTLMIFVNPKEAILPQSVVERNRETIKLMLQGISFDQQFRQRNLALQLLSYSQRTDVLNKVLPNTQGVVRVKIDNEVAFRPIRIRPNELLITAYRYREKIERLKR